MNMPKRRYALSFAAVAVVALAVAGIAVFAAPPRNIPPIQLRWSSTGGGGGESISGGPFTAAVTAGQPITGSAGGGAFAAGSGNWSINVPVRCGDLDSDGDVDLLDYADFSLCIGSACSSAVNADCDGDGDLELEDYEPFVAAMTGPR